IVSRALIFLDDLLLLFSAECHLGPLQNEKSKNEYNILNVYAELYQQKLLSVLAGTEHQTPRRNPAVVEDFSHTEKPVPSVQAHKTAGWRLGDQYGLSLAQIEGHIFR